MFLKNTLFLKKPLFWLFILAAALFMYLIFILIIPNIFIKNEEDKYLFVRDNNSMEDVIRNLDKTNQVFSVFTFKQAATILGYKKIRPGRYELSNGMNNFKLVRILKNGRQTPLKLTFNNIRTKEQLAGRLSKMIMADSLSIVQLMNDSAFLASYEQNPNTSIAVFIPNTYEVFWDMDARELFERMKREYDIFWTEDRKAKAAAIPLTSVEVATLASIVEEETNNKTERPMVAGLYINRLKKEMPLQADPTLKFAVGDFSIKRLKFGHILKISPYNTYRNKGLPPGPIRVASQNGIDAVLNFAKHDYIFMCAKETLNGEHNFAITYAEHQANARRYQKALDALKIN